MTGHKRGDHFSGAEVKSDAFFRNISPEATSAFNKSAGLLLLTLKNKVPNISKSQPSDFQMLQEVLKALS